MEEGRRLNRERTPGGVLAGIAGWQGAAVQQLSGGLSNRTWHVEASDGRRAVLKIDDRPRRPPYNERRAEAQVQSVAAEAGLAGRVLFVSDTVYMTEYMEGAVWQDSSFDDDANLVGLARALRRLHALPLTGRLFDAKLAARQYADRIQAADPEMLAHSLRVIDQMPRPHNLCCCHNDLVAGNILSTPNIRFLDWEYACDNDPFFDLAAIVAHHGLSTRQADRLLDAYFDNDGERWRRQLSRYERFYNAIVWLWRNARRQGLESADKAPMWSSRE